MTSASKEPLPPGFWIGLVMVTCLVLLMHCQGGAS